MPLTLEGFKFAIATARRHAEREQLVSTETDIAVVWDARRDDFVFFNAASYPLLPWVPPPACIAIVSLDRHWRPGGKYAEQFLPLLGLESWVYDFNSAMELFVNQSGQLVLQLTESGRMELASDEHEDAGLYELMEDIRCNSSWDILDARDIGALTSCPYILCADVRHMDNGDTIPHGPIWAHMNYATEDLMATLREHGEIILPQVANSDDFVGNYDIAKAILVAHLWHSGGGSVFYRFASNRRIDDEDHRDLILEEVERCLVGPIEYERDRVELRELRNVVSRVPVGRELLTDQQYQEISHYIEAHEGNEEEDENDQSDGE